VKITVLRENDLVTEIDLRQEAAEAYGELVFLIGRSADCHIHLQDQQVSRIHARLKVLNSQWSIQRESNFGLIQVNGAYIDEHQVRNGDLITIGPFVLALSEISQETQSKEVFSEHDETLDLQETKTFMGSEIPPTKNDDETKEIVTEELNENEPVAENVLNEGFDSGDFEESEQSADSDEASGEFSNEPLGSENTDLNEFSSVGTQNAEFSGENDESFFPEENDDAVDEFAEIPGSDMVSDEDSTRVFQTFAKFQLEIFGEFAPYDKYNLEKNEVLIGRDPARADIILNDPEVSSLHARITKNNASCTVEDLQSGNGTLLNGERINKSPLSNSDEFIIGSTTFTLKVVSDFLQEEEDRLMPVEDNQVVEVEEVVEVDSAFDEDTSAGIDGESFGDNTTPRNQSLVEKFKALPPVKKLIVVGVIIFILSLLVEGDGSKPVEKVEAPVDTSATQVEPEPEEDGIQLSPTQLEQVEASYQLANTMMSRALYDEALREIDEILRIIPEYKNATQLRSIALRAIQERERIEQERQDRIREQERKEKVSQLLVKAKDAVAEKNVPLAESLFTEIILLDPSNFDVSSMRIEIDAWKKEQERIVMEKAQKEAERQDKVSKLQPGKTFYLQKEWYNAIIRLTEFSQIPNMDEDLTKEATRMLEESKENLSSIVGPLLGRARSLREGQDLKGAYENYSTVLEYEPTNVEALNEMNDIREILHNRSRKVYREAIISESLSLFQDAKEKFQEVQQISPSDSEYYLKATNKLKEYID
jgi:pSer/pThr/pTyr-binding forkhead associated (FHA) protein/tetratricopeptide (TPR) repeat protein